MNKKDTIIMIVLIFCLAGLSYMLGIEIGRTNNVTETEMFIIMNEFTN